MGYSDQTGIWTPNVNIEHEPLLAMSLNEQSLCMQGGCFEGDLMEGDEHVDDTLKYRYIVLPRVEIAPFTRLRFYLVITKTMSGGAYGEVQLFVTCGDPGHSFGDGKTVLTSWTTSGTIYRVTQAVDITPLHGFILGWNARLWGNGTGNATMRVNIIPVLYSPVGNHAPNPTQTYVELAPWSDI